MAGVLLPAILFLGAFRALSRNGCVRTGELASEDLKRRERWEEPREKSVGSALS
jgi:hypothetical protein